MQSLLKRIPSGLEPKKGKVLHQPLPPKDTAERQKKTKVKRATAQKLPKRGKKTFLLFFSDLGKQSGTNESFPPPPPPGIDFSGLFFLILGSRRQCPHFPIQQSVRIIAPVNGAFRLEKGILRRKCLDSNLILAKHECYSTGSSCKFTGQETGLRSVFVFLLNKKSYFFKIFYGQLLHAFNGPIARVLKGEGKETREARSV